MLRVFLKKHDFDPYMLIRVMLIKKKRVPVEAKTYSLKRYFLLKIRIFRTAVLAR